LRSSKSRLFEARFSGDSRISVEVQVSSMSAVLAQYRSMWARKPVLRAVYNDIFERIASRCVSGVTLEIGGGIGNLKERINNLISSDIQHAPWLDLVADAQKLPFADAALSNIVMLDVLHHVEFPVLLFKEADRVLRDGGRMIMVEPGISPGSWSFYKLHHEPVDLHADPFVEGVPDASRDPYESNQAIPTLLVTRGREEFHRRFPNLRIREASWFSFVAYPVSGGFQRWSLLPESLVRRIMKAEKYFERAFGKYFGFRLLIVVEKMAAAR